MIEYQPTLDALDEAIATADRRKFEVVAADGWSSTSRRYSLEPELAEARALRASISVAARAYSAVQSAWWASYERAFRLLDRRARYVLSLTTTAPDEIASGADDASHAALIARADSAAASAAPALALAELALYRSAFDSSWSARPSDAGAEGVALTAALARAAACIDFLAWAKNVF